jgi:hypothetical protein
MLIDEFLPESDIAVRHGIDVSAPPARVWRAVRSVDLNASAVNRWLFRARGLFRQGSLSIDDLLDLGFVLLGEDRPQELLLGLVGRPWLPLGGPVRVTPEGFRTFRRPGYARIAWNFSLRPRGGKTRVETETRIRCTDEQARRFFGWYWGMVGPFSAVVRTQALKQIRRRAESG